MYGLKKEGKEKKTLQKASWALAATVPSCSHVRWWQRCNQIEHDDVRGVMQACKVNCSCPVVVQKLKRVLTMLRECMRFVAKIQFWCISALKSCRSPNIAEPSISTEEE
jgi:hypothetical protein